MKTPRRDPSGVLLGSIGVDDARVLRDRVLRAGHSPGGSVYPGDDAADTGHFGAFVDARLVAVASVCREAPRTELGETAATVWRLRGMATADGYRGRGIGERLARRCIAHARGHGATRVWCSARERAVGFYERLGFRVVGEPYELRQFSNERYIEMHLAV